MNNRFARRAFLRLVGQSVPLTFFAAGLAGCGGGGHSLPGPGSPDPTPTPPPGGGPITPEARTAAIQAVTTQMTAWQEAGNVSDQQVVDYLRSRPEFTAAGSVDPGSAWARFADGHTLIVCRNFAEPDPDKSRSVLYTPEQPTRAAGKELPGNYRARVYNALGSAFTPPHDEIRLWMVRHGYELAPEREATVEALKTMGGDGVFYINTHGARCETPDKVRLWSMWTADERTPAKDAQYKDLLDDGSLVYFAAIHDKAPIQNPFNDSLEGNVSVHYAITKRFVERFNWQFAPNSVVFMNCCWSYDYDFGEACLKRKAGAYIGWTNAANPPQAWRAAQFLFDRLLGQLQGANNAYPEADGPQRAFNLPEVFADLRKRGWDKTRTAFGDGELQYAPTNTEFGLLAPSIKYVETDEIGKKLILHGSFGTDPGRGIGYVRVEGADLNIVKWETDKIEADIQPEQYGDVWVQIVTRKSNIRQLTRWDGVMDYAATGPETLKQTAKIKFRIRADVGKYREAPAGPLKDRQFEFMCVNDASATRAHFEYSGEADLFGSDGINSFYTQWTGAGDVVASLDNPLDALVVRGSIDTSARSLRLEVLPPALDSFQYRQYGKASGKMLGGYTDELRPIQSTIADEIFDATGSEQGATLRYLLTGFDGQWALAAEERTVEAKPPTLIPIGFIGGDIKKIPTRIAWQSVPASKPPRETESRHH